LCAKGAALGPGFDRSEVEELRGNLMTYLLQVHVDFIRHYYEQKQSEQARRHIELIKGAQIAPVARKRLSVLVYDAMPSTVPAAVAEGRFGDALTLLEEVDLGKAIQFDPSNLSLQEKLDEIRDALGAIG
jgi:hypothetical protein